jgi:hypothetical protein
MIEASPSLLQLRLLQQIGESGGNTIVLGLPLAGTPAVRQRDIEAAPPTQPELPSDDDQ